MCFASSGRESMNDIMASWSSCIIRVGATAVAVVDRGPGSKSVSSPIISPGPSTASRFSRPSAAVCPSFTLPSTSR